MMEIQNRYYRDLLEVGVGCAFACSVYTFNAKVLSNVSRRGLVGLAGTLVATSIGYRHFRDDSQIFFPQTVAEKGTLFTAVSLLSSKAIASLSPQLAFTVSMSALFVSIVINQIVHTSTVLDISKLESKGLTPKKIATMTSEEIKDYFEAFCKDDSDFKDYLFPHQFAFCKRFNELEYEWKKNENIYEKFSHPTHILSNPKAYSKEDLDFFINEIWGYRRMPLYNESQDCYFDGETALIRDLISTSVESVPLFYLHYSLEGKIEQYRLAQNRKGESVVLTDIRHPYGYWNDVYLGVNRKNLPLIYLAVIDHRHPSSPGFFIYNHFQLNYARHDVNIPIMDLWLNKSPPENSKSFICCFHAIKNKFSKGELSNYELAAVRYYNEEHKDYYEKQENDRKGVVPTEWYSFKEANEWLDQQLLNRGITLNLKKSNVFHKPPTL